MAHLPVPAALRAAGGFIMAGTRALESQYFAFKKYASRQTSGLKPH